jgi:hypothetical protein
MRKRWAKIGGGTIRSVPDPYELTRGLNCCAYSADALARSSLSASSLSMKQLRRDAPTCIFQIAAMKLMH